MRHEHDPEMTDCRNCGAEFDLARQNYYDNICPSCLKEEEPERTWPSCASCGDKIPPGEREYKTVAERRGGTSQLPIHADCKDDSGGRHPAPPV